MVMSHTLLEMEGGRNGELSGMSHCRQPTKPTSSPHDAVSLHWLVTGQVSSKGSEQLFVS